MDRDRFANLVQAIDRLHHNASDLSSVLILPLLLITIVLGALLARWIFRGGLSRHASGVRNHFSPAHIVAREVRHENSPHRST